MKFLAIVRYSHGGRMTHEFRCPLERLAFVNNLMKTDPQASVKLKQRRELDEVAPAGEAEWYRVRKGGDA